MKLLIKILKYIFFLFMSLLALVTISLFYKFVEWFLYENILAAVPIWVYGILAFLFSMILVSLGFWVFTTNTPKSRWKRKK